MTRKRLTFKHQDKNQQLFSKQRSDQSRPLISHRHQASQCETAEVDTEGRCFLARRCVPAASPQPSAT